MPDQTQGREMPEPGKRPSKHRNAPTAFASDDLIFKMTGVRVTEVDGLRRQHRLDGLVGNGSADLAAKFATDKHFAAWTTLAPRQHQSGSCTKFPAQTASRVAKAFRLAARALLTCKSVLGNFSAPAAGLRRHRHRHPGDGLQAGEAVLSAHQQGRSLSPGEHGG